VILVMAKSGKTVFYRKNAVEPAPGSIETREEIGVK
jgi:hypothetical protein